MLKVFQNNLSRILKAKPEEQHFLLAISGGLDSVVLAELLAQSGYKFTLAHCNFHLRGKASDEDEVFVKNLALEYQVPFFSTRFETEKIALKNKKSIQECARDLRYQWLEEIRQAQKLHYTLTAHHLDDNLETVLINLIKGTGIRGLTGIPEKNQKILRPLLSFQRSQLVRYYQKWGLSHREDASNQQEKYTRNKIRHQVVPILKEINPQVLNTFGKELQVWKETALLFEEQIQSWKNRVLQTNGNHHHLHFKELSTHPAANTILYELLRFTQCSSAACQQILRSIQTGQPGSLFYTGTHQILVDREALIIQEKVLKNKRSIDIPSPGITLQVPNGDLEIILRKKRPDHFPEDAWTAYLDAQKLQFPLQLRKWKSGDFFCPLGMKGQRKKIQDLFTDHKLNRFEKEEVWILQNASQEICWVLGIQIDDRYKIDADTNSYYAFCFRSSV